MPDAIVDLCPGGSATLLIAGYTAQTALLHSVLAATAAGYTVFFTVDATGSAS